MCQHFERVPCHLKEEEDEHKKSRKCVYSFIVETKSTMRFQQTSEWRHEDIWVAEATCASLWMSTLCSINIRGERYQPAWIGDIRSDMWSMVMHRWTSSSSSSSWSPPKWENLIICQVNICIVHFQHLRAFQSLRQRIGSFGCVVVVVVDD